MAAEQGYAKAQYNLGLMYSKGEGVLQDYTAAVRWYRIREVICNGDAEQYKYLMGWLANLVQNPFDPARVAVVMRGGKGIGKGAFAEPLRHIFGGHGFYIASSGLLAGRFNAHLEGVCFLFADEAYFAGGKSDEGQLKGLITEPTFALEGKGRDAMLARNRLSILMATNSEWAVRSSNDERRYFVLAVSDSKRNDRDYFKALWSEIAGDGTAAMLHDLLAYDLSGWRVQDIPATEAMADQKLYTAEAHTRWWYERLNDGDLAGINSDWAEDATRVAKADLFEEYLRFAEKDATTYAPLDKMRFYKWFREVCPKGVESRPLVSGLQATVTGGRVRVLDIPPLGVCRAAFEYWIGQPVEWED